MSSEVSDIWFRSKLSLSEIARKLELRDFTEDSENYWHWVIGFFNEAQLDITRTHTLPRNQVDTRIFLLDNSKFQPALILELVYRLHAFVPGVISCGQWIYRSGNDFDLVVVETFTDTFGISSA